jgi:hypothetical protein
VKNMLEGFKPSVRAERREAAKAAEQARIDRKVDEALVANGTMTQTDFDTKYPTPAPIVVDTEEAAAKERRRQTIRNTVAIGAVAGAVAVGALIFNDEIDNAAEKADAEGDQFRTELATARVETDATVQAGFNELKVLIAGNETPVTGASPSASAEASPSVSPSVAVYLQHPLKHQKQ